MDCVVLFSGGIDSATLLWHLLAGGRRCHCLWVNYGQRHRAREGQAAHRLARRAGVEVETLSFNLGGAFGGHPLSALTGATPPGAAASVVPGRNLVLIALAAANARLRGAGAVAVGCQGGDGDAYPDCREGFLRLAEEACGLTLLRPFVNYTKAEVVALARALGVPLEVCWSCYAGGASPCGACGACVARAGAGA